MAYVTNRARRTLLSNLADQLYPEGDQQDESMEGGEENDVPEEAADNRTPMQKMADDLYSAPVSDGAGEEDGGTEESGGVADSEDADQDDGSEEDAPDEAGQQPKKAVDKAPGKSTQKGKAAPEIINGSKSESYDTYVKTGGSRSWRNNNPGNIEYKGQKDAVGVEKGGRFAKFPTPEAGMQALKNLLGTVYKDMDVTSAMKKYAPLGGDDKNNPKAYAKFLEKHGVDIKKPVGLQVDAMAEAIKKQEGWIEGRVTAKK